MPEVDVGGVVLLFVKSIPSNTTQISSSDMITPCSMGSTKAVAYILKLLGNSTISVICWIKDLSSTAKLMNY
jgi:hypothetical protein